MYTHIENTLRALEHEMDDVFRFISYNEMFYVGYSPGNTNNCVSLADSPLDPVEFKKQNDRRALMMDHVKVVTTMYARSQELIARLAVLREEYSHYEGLIFIDQALREALKNGSITHDFFTPPVVVEGSDSYDDSAFGDALAWIH